MKRIKTNNAHSIEICRNGASRLDYTPYNPAEVGIVEKAEDYLYRSARKYPGMKGLIDVICWIRF